jgi:hypothetical protein
MTTGYHSLLPHSDDLFIVFYKYYFPLHPETYLENSSLTKLPQNVHICILEQYLYSSQKFSRLILIIIHRTPKTN